jgi:hypothetical protein
MNTHIRENQNLLNRKFNTSMGVVKLNKNNTLQHEMAKFLLCWEALQNEDLFVTEAIFLNNKRADVFNLSEGIAYEVLHTEKPESILSKQKDYPVKITPFKSTEVIKHYLKQITKGVETP